MIFSGKERCLDRGMKAIPLALFIALLVGGCGESNPEIEDKPTSLVADVEQVVDWVMDNYSSMEDGFAEAEIDLRSSDAPVNKILDDLAKLVSDRRIHSVEKKNELIVLKEKLEGKKLEIEKEMMEADSSMRDSYGLALSEIEGKLDDKIKPLLDFDFQYLDKFERDLNASMLDWKRYLKISDGVLDEELIRNELANRVSEHFRENMAKPIEERKKKWGNAGILRNSADNYEESTFAVSQRRGGAEFERSKRLAEDGDANAQFFIGYSYYVGGADTPKDYRQSFRWYLKAAEQGMSKAQAQVAFMYAYGQGVTKDLAESYAWYNIALENGYWQAREWRNELRLTPDQLAQAKSISKKIKKRIKEN